MMAALELVEGYEVRARHLSLKQLMQIAIDALYVSLDEFALALWHMLVTVWCDRLLPGALATAPLLLMTHSMNEIRERTIELKYNSLVAQAIHPHLQQLRLLVVYIAEDLVRKFFGIDLGQLQEAHDGWLAGAAPTVEQLAHLLAHGPWRALLAAVSRWRVARQEGAEPVHEVLIVAS